MLGEPCSSTRASQPALLPVGVDGVPSLAQALNMPREMCIKLTLGKPPTTATALDIGMLQRALHIHGAISIVGYPPLSPVELRGFASLWGKVLVLPAALIFNAPDPFVPEVARVGNVKLDGTITLKHSAAEYWHHDGDFWEPGQNHIINFLNAVEVPSQGGKTGFLDTRRAYLSLSPENKAKLQGAYTVVHAGDIDDFKALPLDQQPGDVRHAVLAKHPDTGDISMYCPESSSGIQGPDGLQVSDSFEQISKMEADPQQGMVQYKWTRGDLVIWENTTTMHRSLGGYYDEPRLLLRVQVRIRAKEGAIARPPRTRRLSKNYLSTE